MLKPPRKSGKIQIFHPAALKNSFPGTIFEIRAATKYWHKARVPRVHGSVEVKKVVCVTSCQSALCLPARKIFEKKFVKYLVGMRKGYTFALAFRKERH